MRRIPEHEYASYVDGVLHDLAHRIAVSGLTISELARGTRMSRNTVYMASQGLPVRVESACRIIYYLDQYHYEERT